MSVTKSFNKHNNTYYAYDTRYVWDEERQKKIQQKRCIGKFDPVTGEIIPTGKRGKNSTPPDLSRTAPQHKPSDTDYRSDVDTLAVKLRDVSDRFDCLGKELADLTADMNNLLLRMQSKS